MTYTIAMFLVSGLILLTTCEVNI